MENEILLILKKLFTNDISNYIFNIYLINKYFSENLNNKSIQLYKNKFMNTNYSNIIINKINYNYLSLHFIKKLVIIDNTLTLRFLDKIPILIKYLDYTYKNNEEVFIKIIRKDNKYLSR